MLGTCFNCQEKLRPGMSKCVNCGHWNFSQEVALHTPKILLSSVVPTPQNRILTNFCDECFGGGIQRTSVTLLAGEPGAGKSTLLLQLAQSVVLSPEKIASSAGDIILYILTEEGEEPVKERADRLQLKYQDSIVLVNAMGGMVGLTHLLEDMKPLVTILDSLTGFTGSNKKEEAIQVIRALKSYAEKNHSPAIVIDHVTKEIDFAGYMSLLHAVDCLLMLEGAKKMVRTLTTDKSRNGPAPVSLRFEMTELGLIPEKEKEMMSIETFTKLGSKT